MKFWSALAMVAALAGCGVSKHVYLYTADGEPPSTITPKNVGQVEVGEAEYRTAMQWLARDVEPGGDPRYAAHEVFGIQPRVDIQVTSFAEAYQPELVAAYRRWCEHEGTPGDCLNIISTEGWIRYDGRQALAMAMAMGSVWRETADELRGMADPRAVKAMLLTSMTVYMGLLCVPEPTSKVIAANLTAALIAYLGVDTVWILISAYRDFQQAIAYGYSFDQVRDAGHRFGSVLGKSAARVFVMLTTAAIGSSLGLAAKIPRLPGSGQAAQVAANGAGFKLSAVGSVTAVAVAADGAITIALPAGAVATSGSPSTQIHSIPSRVSRVWPEHHPFPKYLGGAADQTLKKIPKNLHVRFHAALDRWKGGKYARSKGADHFRGLDRETVVDDLREFYMNGEGGLFRKYLPDFEQAVLESL